MTYAELTAYPLLSETGGTVECVVFIQDITERVLYQEETLSLYREVIQTTEYLESIIDNSADAIVATDLEIGLRGRYAAEVEKTGAVTVSAKKMFEIVRELPEENIQIRVEDGNWVKIASGRSHFKLVGLPKDEYPSMPDVAEEGKITIAGDALRDMIRKPLYAAGEN